MLSPVLVCINSLSFHKLNTFAYKKQDLIKKKKKDSLAHHRDQNAPSGSIVLEQGRLAACDKGLSATCDNLLVSFMI